MTELFIDIETTPSSDPELLAEIAARHQVPALDLSGIVAAGNIKDEAKIAADLERKRAKAVADHAAAVANVDKAIDEAVRKTAVDTSICQIMCVAWAWDDEPVRSVEGLDEADVLRRFWAAMQRVDDSAYEDFGSRRPLVPTVIAHNSGFDIRGLWRRSLINRISPAPWWPVDARPWDVTRIRDTQQMWMGSQGFIKLDRLCRLLGIPGKQGVDGSMVWDLVREGRLDEVASYCRDDVGERLRPVYRRLCGTMPAAPVIERVPEIAPSMALDHALPDWLAVV